MKKGRPGVLLTVIAERERRTAIEELLFAETTTLGVRWQEWERTVLERESIAVETEFGSVSVKVGRREGRVYNVQPEFDDCLTLARAASRPVKEVWAAALSAVPRRANASDEEDHLPHHADLLRQRRPAPRARLHDGGRGHPGPRAAAARAGRLLPHRHRRARPEHRAQRPARRAWTPRRYCDMIAARFRQLWEKLDITLRPVHPHHGRRSTSAACSRCGAGSRRRRPRRGRPSTASTYSGWYCPRCEAFKDEDELKEPGNLCADPRAALRVDGGGELLLPPLRVFDRGSRSEIRPSAPAHRARGTAQRGAGRDPAGPARTSASAARA